MSWHFSWRHSSLNSQGARGRFFRRPERISVYNYFSFCFWKGVQLRWHQAIYYSRKTDSCIWLTNTSLSGEYFWKFILWVDLMEPNNICFLLTCLSVFLLPCPLPPCPPAPCSPASYPSAPLPPSRPVPLPSCPLLPCSSPSAPILCCLPAALPPCSTLLPCLFAPSPCYTTPMLPCPLLPAPLLPSLLLPWPLPLLLLTFSQPCHLLFFFLYFMPSFLLPSLSALLLPFSPFILIVSFPSFLRNSVTFL